MRAAIAAFVLTLWDHGIAQTTRLVPSQYPTIQSAIGACSNGDDVLVSPGVYAESIDFQGKAIVVHSLSGAQATTIMGSGGRVVTFATGEGPASVLDGFRVTGGNGGILCQNAAPTIQGCVIAGNVATAVGGGGIRCLVTGPGIGSVTIQNCAIANNFTSVQFLTTVPAGGGICFEGIMGFPGSATVTNCLISANAAIYARGGGIMATGNWTLSITGCAIEHNLSISSGGGLFEEGASVTATSCSFTENHSGNAGGGISSDGGLTLIGCAINRNDAFGNGAGVVIQMGATGSVVVRNCTVAANTGGIGQGITVVTPGFATMSVDGSILWGNDGADLIAPSATTTYSDVGFGLYAAGIGNASADPRFVDPVNGDFHLGTSSPCRDAGPPGAMGLPASDLDGAPRVAGPAVDMGADEIPLLSFPGTNEDLDLYLVVNGSGDPLAGSRAAPPGSLLRVLFRSPGGTFAGALPLVAGVLYANGSPPLPPMGFPYVWLNGPVFVVTGALAAPPFTVPGLPSDGLLLEYQIPPGLTGFSLRLQALVSSPFAANTANAVSNASDVVF